MNHAQYLADFLEWERTHPNEPFRDWPGLTHAIQGLAAREIALRAEVETLTSLLQQMLDVAENCDETGYADGVGFVDLDKLHEKVRTALKR